MRVTILTAGSRGDIQPYIALGQALNRLGHNTRLTTFEMYAGLVTNAGLDIYPLKGDLSSILASEAGDIARRADNPLKVLLGFKQLRSYAFDLQQELYNACHGADAIVYHPGVPIGYFIAQQMGIPGILATPFPMAITREYPALIFYDSLRVGRMINQLTHKIFHQFMWFVSSASVRRFWQQQFGTPPPDFGCPYPRQVTASFPTIISCSSQIFPRPSDWSPHVHQTGFWFLDEPGWDPPPSLLDFLENGAPPVYIGFGSLTDPNQGKASIELVAGALRKCAQRGILMVGNHFSGTPGLLTENLYGIDSVPHSWLFPRTSVVVHHGGAGTTAAGLRAGVPAVIIPHSNDQFAWARRLYELGVSAKPLPRKRLDAPTLSASIDQALSQPIRAAANAIGHLIRAEDGAMAAAQVIDCLAK